MLKLNDGLLKNYDKPSIQEKTLSFKFLVSHYHFIYSHSPGTRNLSPVDSTISFFQESGYSIWRGVAGYP